MVKTSRVLALSLTVMMLLFAGASAALATHRPGHQETPSCDPHPTSGGDQNKHCEQPAEPPAPAPAPVTPQQTTPPPDQPTGPAGGGGGRGGGGGGGGGGIAEPATAVTGELPFTGLDLPQAVALASLLFGLGWAALAFGKRRAARIR